MKSNADIIYNHVVKSCNDNIEKIELNGDENLPHILDQYRYKTTNRIFDRVIEKEEAMKKADLNSVILMPYFLKECSKREKELGLNIRLWTAEECVKFETYFMNKYGYLIKQRIKMELVKLIIICYVIIKIAIFLAEREGNK